jgi:hypothetical protein
MCIYICQRVKGEPIWPSFSVSGYVNCQIASASCRFLGDPSNTWDLHPHLVGYITTVGQLPIFCMLTPRDKSIQSWLTVTAEISEIQSNCSGMPTSQKTELCIIVSGWEVPKKAFILRILGHLLPYSKYEHRYGTHLTTNGFTRTIIIPC